MTRGGAWLSGERVCVRCCTRRTVCVRSCVRVYLRACVHAHVLAARWRAYVHAYARTCLLTMR